MAERWTQQIERSDHCTRTQPWASSASIVYPVRSMETIFSPALIVFRLFVILLSCVAVFVIIRTAYAIPLAIASEKRHFFEKSFTPANTGVYGGNMRFVVPILIFALAGCASQPSPCTDYCHRVDICAISGYNECMVECEAYDGWGRGVACDGALTGLLDCLAWSTCDDVRDYREGNIIEACRVEDEWSDAVCQ